MRNPYSLTYLANNNMIQDWVQLPTREERKQWECKQKPIITSARWQKKIFITKHIRFVGAK